MTIEKEWKKYAKRKRSATDAIPPAFAGRLARFVYDGSEYSLRYAAYLMPTRVLHAWYAVSINKNGEEYPCGVMTDVEELMRWRTDTLHHYERKGAHNFHVQSDLPHIEQLRRAGVKTGKQGMEALADVFFAQEQDKDDQPNLELAFAKGGYWDEANVLKEQDPTFKHAILMGLDSGRGYWFAIYLMMRMFDKMQPETQRFVETILREYPQLMGAGWGPDK